MVVPTFSVSEVRVAATCPRIFYFDAEHTRRNRLKSKSISRIWKDGDDPDAACGTLFHSAIDKFNQKAMNAPEIRAVFEGSGTTESVHEGVMAFFVRECVNKERLATKPVPQRQGFIRAAETYLRELAEIVRDARRVHPAEEVAAHLFGDRRRQVNASFPVGPTGEPVHITGILDYVFYDWRTAEHRIIDYKLAPAGHPDNDLFQVALYALMHHRQHRTSPGAAVLYLHPERRMVEMPWSQVHGRRHAVFNLLASMAAWAKYDEGAKAGLKPPGEPLACRGCRWDRHGECAHRLGPKHDGARLEHWSDAVAPPPDDERAPLPREFVPDPGAGSAPLPGTHPLPPPASPEVSPPPIAGGLWIGREADGSPVHWPLSALPTHVAVVGAAGSGKTWMAKVVAEEAARSGVPVLAIDPQGDLVQFLRPSARGEPSSPDEAEARRAFREGIEVRVWTPGTSHGRRLSLNPIRLARPEDLSAIEDPLRRSEEWDALLMGTAGQLADLVPMRGEAEARRAFLCAVLRILARGDGPPPGLDLIARAVADPESIGLEDADLYIRKSDRERLARALNAVRSGPASVLFSGGEPLDLDRMARPDAPGRTPLNVVYLNALADDDLKQAFVAALAAEVYRWMITRATPADPSRPSLLVYLDEARDFIPAGARQNPAKAPLMRLFTQGRKFGVSGLVCTQSPRSVDYTVFGNCSAKLVGRLEAQQDVERVSDWFRDERVPTWLAGRKGAEAGSFIGRWPGMPERLNGRVIRGRPLFSLHEGAWTPDRVERECRDGATLPSAPGDPA